MATYKDTIPREIRERAEKKLDWCMKQLRKKMPQACSQLDILSTTPELRFDKRGVSAGSAHCHKWMIKLNKVYLLEQTENMIEDTIPHEFAHLICHKVFPKAKTNHGPEWKKVCLMLFGKTLDTYHDYCSRNARIGRRVLTRYQYTCEGECSIRLFTKNRHEHTQHHLDTGLGKYWYCKTCGSKVYRFLGMIKIEQ